MIKLKRVFISHAHIDQELATAFKVGLTKIFEECKVSFSSDKSIGGGVDSGANWLEWIFKQVIEADETLILLTPNSVEKAWPMWETGAVSGVALAQDIDTEGTLNLDFPTNVKPVRFQILPEKLPGPFLNIQSTNGEDEGELKKLIGGLMYKYDYSEAPRKEEIVNDLLKKDIPVLRNELRKALRNTPRLITEDIVQEWLHRLDEKRQKRNSRDVKYIHNWIRLMFDGPPKKDNESEEDRIWDLRIHMRLGEMYDENRDYKEAIRQFKIASELAPLDLFIQHRLGISNLGDKNFDEVKRIIDNILELDPEAEKTSAEVAGLIGRYYKDLATEYEDKGEPAEDAIRKAIRKARDAYKVVLEKDPSSYYMADNVGQLSMRIGELDQAKDAYRQAEAALEGIKYENVWSLATAVTTALVLENGAEIVDYLKAIGEKDASEKEIDTIRRGLIKLYDYLEKPVVERETVLKALDPATTRK